MNQVDTRSIQSIRRRLQLLLLRSFSIVVFLTVILILLVTTGVIVRNTDRNPYYRSPTAIIFESFYLGHGSWQGVQSVLEEESSSFTRALRPEWERTILLDASGKVVLDHGMADSPLVGSPSTIQPPQIGKGLLTKGP